MQNSANCKQKFRQKNWIQQIVRENFDENYESAIFSKIQQKTTKD